MKRRLIFLQSQAFTERIGREVRSSKPVICIERHAAAVKWAHQMVQKMVVSTAKMAVELVEIAISAKMGA